MPVACRNSVKCPPPSSAPARNREPPSNVLALRTRARTSTSPNRFTTSGAAPATAPKTASLSIPATRHRITYGSAANSNRFSALTATPPARSTPSPAAGTATEHNATPSTNKAQALGTDLPATANASNRRTARTTLRISLPNPTSPPHRNDGAGSRPSPKLRQNYQGCREQGNPRSSPSTGTRPFRQRPSTRAPGARSTTHPSLAPLRRAPPLTLPSREALWLAWRASRLIQRRCRD